LTTQVWSCGGGVQSAAIAALIVTGRLSKPDISLIVDTEREKSTTWAYYDSVLKPELAKVGVDLIRVPKSKYATVDLFSGNGDLLIPAFTNKDGTIGKLPTYCSNEWKRRVIMRYLRAQNVERCQNWLGISLDELKRVRTGPPAWFQPRYVFIYEIPMRRNECVEVVAQLGWPPAPRSSCWMCPNHDDGEWASMSTEDLIRASEFEKDIQTRDPHVWLHRSCKPIATVDFTDAENDDNGCQTGFCFT
jgi:hypothetical protein